MSDSNIPVDEQEEPENKGQYSAPEEEGQQELPYSPQYGYPSYQYPQYPQYGYPQYPQYPHPAAPLAQMDYQAPYSYQPQYGAAPSCQYPQYQYSAPPAKMDYQMPYSYQPQYGASPSYQPQYGYPQQPQYGASPSYQDPMNKQPYRYGSNNYNYLYNTGSEPQNPSAGNANPTMLSNHFFDKLLKDFSDKKDTIANIDIADLRLAESKKTSTNKESEYLDIGTLANDLRGAISGNIHASRGGFEGIAAKADAIIVSKGSKKDFVYNEALKISGIAKGYISYIDAPSTINKTSANEIVQDFTAKATYVHKNSLAIVYYLNLFIEFLARVIFRLETSEGLLKRIEGLKSKLSAMNRIILNSAETPFTPEQRMAALDAVLKELVSFNEAMSLRIYTKVYDSHYRGMLNKFLKDTIPQIRDFIKAEQGDPTVGLRADERNPQFYQKLIAEVGVSEAKNIVKGKVAFLTKQMEMLTVDRQKLLNKIRNYRGGTSYRLHKILPFTFQDEVVVNEAIAKIKAIDQDLNEIDGRAIPAHPTDDGTPPVNPPAGLIDRLSTSVETGLKDKINKCFTKTIFDLAGNNVNKDGLLNIIVGSIVSNTNVIEKDSADYNAIVASAVAWKGNNNIANASSPTEDEIKGMLDAAFDKFSGLCYTLSAAKGKLKDAADYDAVDNVIKKIDGVNMGSYGECANKLLQEFKVYKAAIYKEFKDTVDAYLLSTYNNNPEGRLAHIRAAKGEAERKMSDLMGYVNKAINALNLPPINGIDNTPAQVVTPNSPADALIKSARDLVTSQNFLRSNKDLKCLNKAASLPDRIKGQIVDYNNTVRTTIQDLQASVANINREFTAYLNNEAVELERRHGDIIRNKAPDDPRFREIQSNNMEMHKEYVKGTNNAQMLQQTQQLLQLLANAKFSPPYYPYPPQPPYPPMQPAVPYVPAVPYMPPHHAAVGANFGFGYPPSPFYSGGYQQPPRNEYHPYPVPDNQQDAQSGRGADSYNQGTQRIQGPPVNFNSKGAEQYRGKAF